MLTAIAEGYRRRRFAWLFCSLILTVGVSPGLRTIAPRVNVIELFLAVNLIAAVATVGREHGAAWMLWISGAFVALRAVQALLGTSGLIPLTQGVWLTGGVLATLATARHAFRSGDVDGERIYSALDAYLLAGLVFGVGYWVLGQLDPAAFNEAELSLARATYFSFVTIATLGYGDVVPRSELAQSLAIVEAVGGQMYLAVLVARLVSLYSRQAERGAA